MDQRQLVPCQRYGVGASKRAAGAAQGLAIRNRPLPKLIANYLSSGHHVERRRDRCFERIDPGVGDIGFVSLSPIGELDSCVVRASVLETLGFQANSMIMTDVDNKPCSPP